MRPFLASLLIAILLPVSAGSQGGDAVFRSLRVQIPIAREYLEPQGLQDAAEDLLTADMSTSSATYVTIMSGEVTVGEAGDAVLVHLTGQIGWTGRVFYVADQSDDQLWRIDDPTSPGGAVLVGAFPSGLQGPGGITLHGGSLYVVDDSGNSFWRIDDPTNPGGAVLVGAFPSGLNRPNGITSHGGVLYVANSTNTEEALWRIDDPTSPGGAVLVGAFPSGLQFPSGITSHGGSLYVNDATDDALWRIDDPTNPGGAVLVGAFPSTVLEPQGITKYGGKLYFVENFSNALWRIDYPTNPGGAVLEGNFPAGLNQASGITTNVSAPCMIRLARGTTEIEGVVLDSGRILFDATFVDAPPVGTHTYALQMRTQDPNTVCTAYRGDGSVPMPSMLVQSFYAGSIP